MVSWPRKGRKLTDKWWVGDEGVHIVFLPSIDDCRVDLAVNPAARIVFLPAVNVVFIAAHRGVHIAARWTIAKV
jgi:hypothetical protein